MKKLLKLFVPVLVLAIAGFVYLSCDSTSDSPAKDEIKFKIDGKFYSLKEGPLGADWNNGLPAAYKSSSTLCMRALLKSDDTSGSGIYVRISEIDFENKVSGTYPVNGIYFKDENDAAKYLDLTIIITAYDENGYVTGTFSGVTSDGDELPVTDGSFSLKMIADPNSQSDL